MKINVEVSGLKIGVDNAITEAMKTGEWGVKLVFVNDDNGSRFEVALHNSEVPELIENLEQALANIKTVQLYRENLEK